MLDEVARFLPTECQLEPGKVVLVGVSGGVDSLCLFDLIERAGYPIAAAYYNHNLRPEAVGESVFVQKLAKDRGVSFVRGEGDVQGFAEKANISIQIQFHISTFFLKIIVKYSAS